MVRFISGFHPVIDFSGKRHHNPDAPGGSPSGAAEGGTIAHLTGTTRGLLESAAELHAASVQIVYSPMLGAAVASRNGWSGIVESGLESVFTRAGRAGTAQTSLARRIGRMATRVAAENEFMAGYLEEAAGIEREKIVTVEMPPLGNSLTRIPGEENMPLREGNLLVALCDDLIPDGNVLRLIFALEKINADAVIVTARAAGEYAQSCQERAEMNPRLKMIHRSGDGAGTDAGVADSVTEAMERATIVVDPSMDGICYPFVAAAVSTGIGAVISNRSSCRLSMSGGVELFEPSSWELLNHAMTTAFNRGADSGAASGEASTVVNPSGADIASTFRELYAEISRGVARV